jgi:hypothetical protein
VNPENQIQIMRVLGKRTNQPVVLASVNDYLVRWQPRGGWTCTCDPDEFPECPHIRAVETLIDPRVTGEHTRRPDEPEQAPTHPDPRGTRSPPPLA